LDDFKKLITDTFVPANYQNPPVEVEIHGSMIKIPLVVHPLPTNIDCLLGLDWFKNAKAVIDTVDKVLQFKSRKVCLGDTKSSKLEFQQECYVNAIIVNTEKPIYQHPYRKSIKEREDIKCEVAEMHDCSNLRTALKNIMDKKKPH
jgi:hypothetical protein